METVRRADFRQIVCKDVTAPGPMLVARWTLVEFQHSFSAALTRYSVNVQSVFTAAPDCSNADSRAGAPAYWVTCTPHLTLQVCIGSVPHMTGVRMSVVCPFRCASLGKDIQTKGHEDGESIRPLIVG